jgi:AcrR family transcriptional regulator
MRRLASELGVSTMAPYRHVGSKDELLIVLVDRLAARLVYPPRPADPKGAMLVLWSTIYDSLAQHPWVPEVLARRRMMAPSVLGAIEEIHAALRHAGLSIEAAVRAYRLMWNFTLGSLLVRAGASSEGPSQQRELRGAPDPKLYPILAAAAAAWAAAYDRDTYREDLGALIDALLAAA